MVLCRVDLVRAKCLMGNRLAELHQCSRIQINWLVFFGSGWPPLSDQRRNTAYIMFPSYCSFAYSALACSRIGMSGSAFFQRTKKF